MLALQTGAAWAEERLLGTLRQSVPHNGRVHLHIIDFGPHSTVNTGRITYTCNINNYITSSKTIDDIILDVT